MRDLKSHSCSCRDIASRGASKHLSHGLSLLELLVVIATITTLMTMMLPSFGKAKELTRRLVCATNLRQLGVGLKMYANQNDGWYPVEELCGNPQAVLIASLFPEYTPNRSLRLIVLVILLDETFAQ